MLENIPAEALREPVPTTPHTPVGTPSTYREWVPQTPAGTPGGFGECVSSGFGEWVWIVGVGVSVSSGLGEWMW